MERIRIQNLRCLADTQPIEIKPITLLVGANSSGKSTFLRVFPLLKQSAETRTMSGILLNEGDVNFGFFPEAVHRDANPSELRLGFGVLLKNGIFQGGYANRFLLAPLSVMCDVHYRRRAKDARYPYISSVNLTLGTLPNCDRIEILADEDGKVTRFRVNSYQANGEIAHLRLRVGRGVVPTLASSLGENSSDMTDLPDDDESLDGSAFEKKLLQITEGMFHGRTNRSTKLALLRSIGVGSPEAMLARAREIGSVNTWSQNVAHWTIDSWNFKSVRNLVLAKYTGEILIGVNNYVSQLATSIHYFQPVRASVERDYLSRDVQVNSIDPRGGNVAMVLASLSPTALSKFREWMLLHFGFEVYPQSVGDGARIALRMKEAGSDAEFNLADMGFGFSQMLPFLLQIWYVVERVPSRPRNRAYITTPQHAAIPSSYIIAIEQPELHLHPALQSRLADLFVSMAKLSQDRKIPVRFILETHSPVIIERVGSHIEAGNLQTTDVQVLLFERGEDGADRNTACVRLSEFDEAGVLRNWPFGFLAPLPTPVAKSEAELVAQ